jgi:2-(1,2-epoxy-1,2-dihydrophenyl)acetyl-CoA isomerase
LAARSSAFIQAFSKIGLIPDSGGTYTLPKLIGFQKATALMFLGDKVNAEEADALATKFREIMESIMQLNVPLKASLNIGDNWGELK